MFYRIKDNKIVDCADFKYSEDCLETDKKIVRSFNGELVFEEETQTIDYLIKKKEFEELRLIDILRSKREKECFVIINRGSPWYDTLSDTQKEELKVWYQAWLDVTKTKIIPNKPAWLK